MNLVTRITFSIVSALVYLSVLIFSWTDNLQHGFPSTWTYGFCIIMVIMMVLSVLAPYCNSKRSIFGLMVIRLLLAVVVMVPSLFFERSLYLLVFGLLTLEGFLYLPGYLAFGPCVILILQITWLFGKPMTFWNGPMLRISPSHFAANLGVHLVFGVFGYSFSSLKELENRNRSILRGMETSNYYLAQTNMGLQEVAARAEQDTKRNERRRIAREIHDTISHTLINLLSLLDSCQLTMMVKRLEVPEQIVQAQALIRQNLGEIRSVVWGLRHEEEDSTRGLADIGRLANTFQEASGVGVVLLYGDAPMFPGAQVEYILFRVAQEGLTNALRHGSPSEVLISFRSFKGGIEMTVKDDGSGTDRIHKGLGLTGIKERVVLAQGKFCVKSQPEMGFMLRVWLPLH